MGMLIILLCLASMSYAQYTPAQFVNPVPIPYLVEGSGPVGTSMIDLDFAATNHNFDPNGATASGLPTAPGNTTIYKIDVPVRTWAINSPNTRFPANAPDLTYLGTTINWKRGNMIDMAVTNNLPSNSSTEPGQGQTTTSHWHGLNVPAYGDGGPHQAIPNSGPNQTWTPTFPMVDPEQTLWYHSHVMEYTTEQVIMGLSGLIIVEDTMDAATVALHNALPHDYNANDFPLIIQDKGFVFDTMALGGDSLLLTATGMKVSEKPGDGQFRIVNGVALGNLEVPNSMVRFRVLNGDARKSFNIGFSTNIDTSDQAARLTFYQVASDGGYMGAAHPMTSFLINPGERGEFLVDFSSANIGSATEVFLSNLSSAAEYADVKDIVGLGGDRKNAGPLNPGLAIMKFTVNPNLPVPDPKTALPDANLFPVYTLDNCPMPRKRIKELLPKDQAGGQTWTIDGTPMDMMVLNDTVCVNTCERWTIKNQTVVAHPFHIHKVQFQIVQYVDSAANPPVTYDYPNLPPTMLGYKDVIIVRKKSQVTFQARFDDFGADTIMPSNGYMYHCHILTHEDASMMHQFTVVSDSICNALNLNVSTPELVDKQFQIFPNPSHDQLYFRGTASKRGRIEITDMLGRVLYEGVTPPFEGTLELDVSAMPRGMVMVSFYHEGERLTRKILLD